MTNIPNNMKMIPTTRFTVLIGIRSAILVPAKAPIEFTIKKPITAPRKTITGNGDWAARARVAIWLLSPSSESNTIENIPKSVPGLSHVSIVSEFELANVKIPKIRNKNPDT